MLLILKRLGSKPGSTVKQSSGLYLEVNTHSHNQHLRVRELTSRIPHVRAEVIDSCNVDITEHEEKTRRRRVGTYLPE